MTKKEKTRQKIKDYILKNPEMALTKNKHHLNVIIMRARYPKLQELQKELLYRVLKDTVDVDRDARKAKEELREENKLDRDDNEELLVTALQQEKQMELGYGDTRKLPI